MLRRTLLTLLAVLVFAVPLAGCFYSREIARTRRDIERAYPDARFDREIVVNLGPGSMRALGWLAGLVPEDEPQMASDYLYEISRVKVGVYRTEDLPDLDAVNLSAVDRFERDGWDVAAQMREDDEVFWLLYKERRNEVRDLYVVVLSEEELVLARIRGHLNRLMTKIVEDHDRWRDYVELGGGM